MKAKLFCSVKSENRLIFFVMKIVAVCEFLEA